MKNKMNRKSKQVSNKSRGWLIAALCCCGAASAAAQGTDLAAGDSSGIGGFLAGFAQQHAWVTTALLIIGGLRVVFKPVMALIDTFVKSNCSPEEYARLQSFEAGPVYKWISFGFNFVGSVKLPVIGIKPAKSVDANNS